MDETKVEIVNALGLMFQAEAQKSRANLINYLNKSAGVGEHPDVVLECKRLVEKIEHANSCFMLLQQMFVAKDGSTGVVSQ